MWSCCRGMVLEIWDKVGRRLWSRGWQSVRPSPKHLEINELFEFFKVVMCIPYI